MSEAGDLDRLVLKTLKCHKGGLSRAALEAKLDVNEPAVVSICRSLGQTRVYVLMRSLQRLRKRGLIHASRSSVWYVNDGR
jgi:hypothetical protein